MEIVWFQAKDSQEELFLGRGVLSADAQRKVKNETRQTIETFLLSFHQYFSSKIQQERV